ncbi:long-chain fatty acid--CoA ligase [Myxococcota bacterium]|nr:long-chain fatty acid--CoA ligase [Myxococcota bacterium]
MDPRFPDFVRHYARRRPGHVAVRDLASSRQWTYRELDERIERLASHLATRLGVARGDRVAVLCHNSTDVYELQFACWRIGAIFLPLNWRLAARELQMIVADAEPSVLVHDRALAELTTTLNVRVKVETTGAGGASGYEGMIAAGGDVFTPADAKLSDVGTLMYTSGTTGRAKGALITHAMTFYNAVNLAIAARVTRDSVHLVALPLFHTGGLNCYSNVVFHAGGTNVVMRAWDPAKGLAVLADRAEGITHFFGVPAHYQGMAALPAFEGAELRLVNSGVGGAPCPLPMLEQWSKKGVPMQQGYGLTETSPTALILDTERALDKLGSCGLPALHNEVILVDREGVRITEPGVVGEIWVRGPNVCPGYWRRPEANAGSFEKGWLKTGDAARQDDDGFFYIVDRWKDMFISGGENVYPAEVENAIYEVDGVLEVAVIGVPDARWGEVGRACVVRRSGSAVTADEILEHTKRVLAKYKVPRSVVFVEALPRNAAGKVLKQELRTAVGSGGRS